MTSNIPASRRVPRRDDTAEYGYGDEAAGRQRWEVSRGGVTDFLLFFGMSLSLLGEVASVLADQPVPASLFLLSTLLLCGVAWKRGGL